MPEPLVKFRRDALWGYPEQADGRSWYPRPADTDQVPENLADVAGPAAEFLLRAEGFREFVT
jgi:hypothetical protein